MHHCWKLSSQASPSNWRKTRDRAHCRKTFSITASCLHTQRQTLHFPLQAEQTVCLVLIPAEFAGKESCEQCWDAPGPQDLLTFAPFQTGAQRAPASGTGRCRTTASALQALLLSPAGEDSKHAGPLGVLLGWMSRGRDRCQVFPPSGAIRPQRVERSISPAASGRKLPRLFVARGLEEGTGSRERFISVTLRGAGSLEKLSVPWKRLKPRRQPLSSLRGRLRAQPRRPCPAGRRSRAPSIPPSGPAARPGRCCRGSPGWGKEKGTAAPGMETAAGTGGGRAAGTAAFPGPRGSPAPFLPPSRTSSINSSSRLTRPEGKVGRHRAKETYILCGHR